MIPLEAGSLMNGFRKILLGTKNSSPSYNFKRVEWVGTAAVVEMQLNKTKVTMNFFQVLLGRYVFHIFGCRTLCTVI